MARKTPVAAQSDVSVTKANNATPSRSRPTNNSRSGRKTTGKAIKIEDRAADASGAVDKSPAAETKASIVLKTLSSAKGATIEAMMEATGWQSHSVRGFLSAVVRKKLGHDLVSEPGKDGVRRYRIQSVGKVG